MGYISFSYCNNCGHCLRSGTGIPIALNEKGELASLERRAPFDGVFSTEKICKHCKTDVKTYRFRTDFDELWEQVQALKAYEYVCEQDLDDVGIWYDAVPYLEKRGILGPEEQHHYFFKHRKVLLTDEFKKDDLVPKFVYKADESCIHCGNKDFCESGDTCPFCENGVFEYDEDGDMHYQ